MNKLKKLIVGISPIFISLGVEIIIFSMISIVLFLLIIFQGMKSDYQIDSEALNGFFQHIITNPNILLVIMLFMNMILGVILFAWYLNMKPFSTTTIIKRIFTIKNISMLLLLGIGSQFFISGVLSLIEPYFIDTFNEYKDLMKVLVEGNPLLIILNVVIIAPIVEEVIFRGIMLHKTKEIMPFIGANLLQAALFGIYHRNIIQGIYAFGLGIVLGYVVYKFNTLFAGILLHTIVNASSFFVSIIVYNIGEHNKTYFGLVGTGFVILMVGLIQLIKFKKITEASQENI